MTDILIAAGTIGAVAVMAMLLEKRTMQANELIRAREISQQTRQSSLRPTKPFRGQDDQSWMLDGIRSYKYVNSSYGDGGILYDNLLDTVTKQIVRRPSGVPHNESQ